MKEEPNAFQAFWEVLNSPTGEKNLRRESRLKLPTVSLPRIEFPEMVFPGAAAS